MIQIEETHNSETIAKIEEENNELKLALSQLQNNFQQTVFFYPYSSLLILIFQAEENRILEQKKEYFAFKEKQETEIDAKKIKGEVF